MSDGDRAFLFWLPAEGKFQLTSSQDPRFEDCTLRDVRRTIYWALGEDPETCALPLTIYNLSRNHSELLKDGEPWDELCTSVQCAELLDEGWHSYAANKIFLTFDVA